MAGVSIIGTGYVRPLRSPGVNSTSALGGRGGRDPGGVPVRAPDGSASPRIRQTATASDCGGVVGLILRRPEVDTESLSTLCYRPVVRFLTTSGRPVPRPQMSEIGPF